MLFLEIFSGYKLIMFTLMNIVRTLINLSHDKAVLVMGDHSWSF